MRRNFYSAADHLQHYPQSRRTTIARLQTFEKTTEQIKRENEADRLRNKTRLDREPKTNAFIRLLAWMWRK